MFKYNADEISKELLAAIQAAAKTMGEKADISLQTTTKVNDVEKVGICIGTGNETVKPTMYIDREVEMIRNGDLSIKECADTLLSQIRLIMAHETGEIAATVKSLFENVDKSRITLQIISKEKNEKLLKNAPHRDLCGDLSLIARYHFNEDASAIINNGMAQGLGMTSSEVIEAGIKNISAEGYEIKSMSSLLAGMMGVSEEEFKEMEGIDKDAQMYVVTNEAKLYGAAGIFADCSVRERVADTIGKDFYIIPSSTHEVICTAADKIPSEEMTSMINDVNCAHLLPEDVLSNHPYLVNFETLKISNPCIDIMADTNSAVDKITATAHM